MPYLQALIMRVLFNEIGRLVLQVYMKKTRYAELLVSFALLEDLLYHFLSNKVNLCPNLVPLPERS